MEANRKQLGQWLEPKDCCERLLYLLGCILGCRTCHQEELHYARLRDHIDKFPFLLIDYIDPGLSRVKPDERLVMVGTVASQVGNARVETSHFPFLMREKVNAEQTVGLILLCSWIQHEFLGSFRQAI